jgi:lysophospholipase L1-like esterase
VCRPVILALALISFCAAAQAAPASDTPVRPSSALDGAHWVSAWGSSQLIPDPQDALPPESLHGATLRQVVHLSMSGGRALRLHLSNAFGGTPLHLLAVHVARPMGGATDHIDPASDRAVLFDGRPEVLIAAGAEYVSDPLDYPVPADLAISLKIEAAPQPQTGHPGSHATTYLAQDTPPDAPALPMARTVEHWYFLSGVDVAGPGETIVALGDSITDGHGATTDGNDRWTDVLAARLQSWALTSGLTVVNAGIAGNRLLQDGLGPNAIARFDRDVLARSEVRYLIVLEGINDLGTLTREGPVSAALHGELVRRMIGAYRQIVLRAHAHGIQVIGGTLLPSMGNSYHHPEAANERDRQAINAWIREPGHFDVVIDFDRMTADPAQPDHLRADYDSGDHLHPSPAGYRAMGEAIPLTLFGDLRTGQMGAPAVPPPVGEAVLDVPICLLLQASGSYDHRLIRISGIVTHGYESFGISDRRCGNQKTIGLLPGAGGIQLTYGGTKVPQGVFKGWGGPTRAAPLSVDGIETTLAEDAMLQRFDALTRGPTPAYHTSVTATLTGRYFSRGLYGIYEGPLLVIQQVSSAVQEARPRRP